MLCHTSDASWKKYWTKSKQGLPSRCCGEQGVMPKPHACALPGPDPSLELRKARPAVGTQSSRYYADRNHKPVFITKPAAASQSFAPGKSLSKER